MFKMSFITLVGIYLVLVVLGRDGPEGQAVATVTAVPKAGFTRVTPETATEGQLAAVPVRVAPMPGPSLRPSPEHAVLKPDTATAAGALFAVTASSANVRFGPAVGTQVVGRLSRNEEVLVVADPGNGWVQIRIEGDGLTGWMSRKLLRPMN